MATDAPKITPIMCIAAKAETTTGVAIVVTAAEATLIVFNFSMTPDEPANERQAMAGKGQLASAPGAQSGKCSFEVELTGAGTTGVPPWASTFLPACDWENTTGTFSPVNGVTTLTIVAYEDGLRRQLTGCRGDFTITAVNGQPGRVKFDFTGKYIDTAVTDVSILAPTFPTVLAPIFAGGTCTLGSFAPVLSKIMVAAGNVVGLREDATNTDKSGYKAAFISNRKSTGSMDPEAVAVATRDWRAILMARTEEALSIVIGASANNIITIAAAKAQTVKTPRGNRNDLMTDEIALQLNSTTPFTIAFS
jgi:hypothetical protein